MPKTWKGNYLIVKTLQNFVYLYFYVYVFQRILSFLKMHGYIKRESGFSNQILITTSV